MAPTRSSSLSTTISKSSQDGVGGIKKKFSCTFAACGKSFSRSEHLHRHALNHKDGNNTCMRCSAHFRRRDLLDRHMARHKEKDDEAGGDGLGILATRKRLWRDETGKIVNARRPSYVQESGSGKRRQIRKASQTSCEENSESKNTLPRMKTRRGNASGGGETIVVDTGNAKAGAGAGAGASKYARMHGESETTTAVHDSWLAMTALTQPLPHLRSPSSSPDRDDDQEAELDTLYDDFYPSLSSHSSLSTASQNSPIESSYPAPSWGGTSLSLSHSHSPFQTFMGAVSSSPDDDLSPPLSPSHPHHHQHHHNSYSPHHHHNNNSSSSSGQYNYPSHPTFIKAESQPTTTSTTTTTSSSASLLDFENASLGLGRGLYEWTPQSWNGNVSRCREEKWDPRESLTLPALGMAGMGSGMGMGMGLGLIAEAGYGVQEGMKRGWSVVR